MILNKAILHIFDFNSGICVFSGRELSFSGEAAGEFLDKHIEKIIADPDSKAGHFKSDSDFLEILNQYRNQETDFSSFSASVGNVLYNLLSGSDKPDPADFVMAEFYMEDTKYLAMMLFTHKTAYTHQIINDSEGVHNEIIRHRAILPGTAQKADSYALINMENCDIVFSDKKRMIDGKECYVLRDEILSCDYGVSSKEAVKTVNKIVNEVAQEHGENAALIVSRAKQYISESAEESETLDLGAMSAAVFGESEIMQRDFEDKMAETPIPESVHIEKSYAQKSTRMHKIRTDTGIEISVPSEYMGDSEYITFINNPDGTISIELKNIGKLINR